MTSSSGDLSRRRFLQAGAAAAAAATAGAVVASPADAAPAPKGYAARVLSVDNLSVTTVALHGGRRATVPYAGFPKGVKPRVGDIVTVGQPLPEREPAALPSCTWYEGDLEQVGPDLYSVGGETFVRAASLGDTILVGHPAKVCLLDTEQSVAQPLTIQYTG
jgi:hypothetical protein